jgi:hypothetical protein
MGNRVKSEEKMKELTTYTSALFDFSTASLLLFKKHPQNQARIIHLESKFHFRLVTGSNLIVNTATHVNRKSTLKTKKKIYTYAYMHTVFYWKKQKPSFSVQFPHHYM